MACDETFSRFSGKKHQQAKQTPALDSTANLDNMSHAPSQQSFPDRKMLGPLPLHATTAIYQPGDWENKSPPLRPPRINRQKAA